MANFCDLKSQCCGVPRDSMDFLPPTIGERPSGVLRVRFGLAVLHEIHKQGSSSSSYAAFNSEVQ